MLVRNQHLFKSLALCLWSAQITSVLTKGTLLIFLQSGLEKLLARPGFEPTTFHLGSLSGTYDHQLYKYCTDNLQTP